MTEEELKQQEEMHKKVVVHQELISTWTSNRMERDKQILTLSALAIGLLMTFRSEIDDIHSLVFWLLAGIFFLVSIGLILWIFGQNSEYIMQLFKNEDEEKVLKTDRSLEYKTHFVLWSFFVGVVLTCALAIYRVMLAF